ncbi:MAG: hypothetical protein AAGA66_18235, partial [Bacteroidota bacterium]
QSCLEDDLSFPEEDEGMRVNSLAMITLLNRVTNNVLVLDNAPCIEFSYPVNLLYNTGSSIKIDSEEGLQEVAKNQSAGLHVVGFRTPFEVITNNTTVMIEEDEDLLKVLLACELGSFQSDFDQFFLNCFDFIYPVELIDQEGVERSFESLESFINFVEFQNGPEQPNFKFPVGVTSFPSDESTQIQGYFDFYQLFDQCESCPSLSFITEDLNDGSVFEFMADFREKDDFVYEWVVVQNGDTLFKETETPGGDNLLIYQFTPGMYEVCLVAKDIVNRCSEIPTVCKVLEVMAPPPLCLDPLYSSFLIDEPGYYEFDALILEEEASIKWLINDVPVQGATESVMEYNFMSDSVFNGFGRYEVCLEVTTPFCTESRRYCEEIIVRDECLGLFFIISEESEGFYGFKADFPLMNQIRYEWEVTQQGDLIASEIEDIVTGNNAFNLEFPGEGTYKVCIKALAPNCNDEEIMFCQEIRVD